MFSCRLLEEKIMSLNRVRSILLQEYFVTLRSIEVIMDIMFFPLMSIVVFGFLSLYLAGSANQSIGRNLLLGMLLWQVIYIIQYSVSVGSLWNIWSRNLSNLFITPLQVKEYILAHILSGICKALFIFGTSSIMSIFVFNYNIFEIGIVNLFLFLINLVLFSFAMGVTILGLIFRFGTRIQAFAWGLLPMFQPLTAAFYPVSVLPEPLKIVAYMLPPTYVFEAARYSISSHEVNWFLLGIAFVENIVYCLLAIWFFSNMFRKSRDSGQFARNEG